MNRQILRLAIPSILANIIIPLVGLVDTAIVGHISDAHAIGGIAIGTMLFDLLYWNFGFLRVDEALEILIAYIDDALMVNAEQVSILHGTGTGALKQVVRDYLAERQKSMRRLQSGDIVFHDGDPDRGGAGITIVEL